MFGGLESEGDRMSALKQIGRGFLIMAAAPTFIFLVLAIMFGPVLAANYTGNNGWFFLYTLHVIGLLYLVGGTSR